MGDDPTALPGEGTRGDRPCVNGLESEVVERGVDA